MFKQGAGKAQACDWLMPQEERGENKGLSGAHKRRRNGQMHKVYMFKGNRFFQAPPARVIQQPYRLVLGREGDRKLHACDQKMKQIQKRCLTEHMRSFPLPLQALLKWRAGISKKEKQKRRGEKEAGQQEDCG